MIDETLLTVEQRQELEEVVAGYSLDSKRFNIKYRGTNHYVVIAYSHNVPVEIFISTMLENDPNTASGMTALTRFITLALKAYPLGVVVKQLNRASMGHHDLPGMLAKLLNNDHILL